MAACLTKYKFVITFADRTQKVMDAQAMQQFKLPKGAVLTPVEIATAKPPAKLITKRVSGQLVFEVEGEGVIAQIQDSDASPSVVSLNTSLSPAIQQEITGQAVASSSVSSSSSPETCAPTVAVTASSTAMAAGSWGFLGAGTAGAIGGAAALLSSKSEPGPASVVARVVAGPVLAGNDLEATIYKADGVSLLGTGRIGADGTVTVSVGNYTGVVVVKVQNNGGPTDPDNIPDYRDEATLEEKDLGSAVLYSTGVLTQEGATLVLNVNILTSLAHHIAKERTQTGVPLDASTVVSSNTAIANAFDLNDLTGEVIKPTVDQTGADSANTANLYGKVLAALSGADALNGGDSQQTFVQLADSIAFDGSTATLQTAAVDLVIEGAKTADPTNTIELVKKLSDATTLASRSVSIDTVSSNNSINASEAQSTTVSGTCDAGASVTLTLGGNARTATVTGTTWSYALTAEDLAAMGQGSENILVTATLNGQSASASRGIYVDTLIPTAPTVNALRSNDTTPVITGNSAPLTSDERLTVSVNGATYNVRPNSAGAWSLDLGTATPTIGALGALANGQSYTVRATVSDAAGNTSPEGISTLSIDTTPPTLTMNAVSGGLINSAAAQSALVLSGTSNAEDGQIVSFTLGNRNYTATVNGGAWSATVPSADLQALPQGILTLRPQVTDAAGNLTELNPAASVLVDTVAPAQPGAAANMLDSSDTGASTTDNNTRNTRPELQVGALPSDAASVELLVNGQRVAATYNSQTGVLQPTSALPDGVHAVSYRYVDAAGNPSPASAPLSVTIDATAPINLAITGATAGGITGRYEVGTTLALTIDGRAVQPLILDTANGTWRYVPDPQTELPALRSMQGSQQVVLTATDTAGNSASANRTVSADDFNGPYIKEFIPADSGVVANSVNGTATLNLVFSKEVVKGTGNIQLVRVDDPTVVVTIPVTSNSVVIQGGNDVYITLPGLTIGRHYYVTLAAGTFVDSAGEAFIGRLATGTSGWDFTAAAASISPDFVAGDDIINIAENGAAVVITGKVVGSQPILNAIVAGNLTITVNVPQGQPALPAITPVYNDQTGEFSFSVPANAWREGTYGYTVNLAGGSGAATGVTANYVFNDLRVDLTAPTMSASVQGAQDNVGTIAGDIWAAGTTATSDDTTPVISGTLSAALAGDARVVVYRRDVTNPNNPGSLQKITGSEGLVPTGLSWSVSDSGLQDGRRYDYVAYVEDAAGNRSQATPVKTILIDTTAPTVQMSTLTFSQDSGASNSDRITNVASQTVTGTLSGALAAGETLHASLDGGQTWVDIPSSAVNGTTVTWSGVTLPQGQGQMQFRVKDAAGNQGAAGTLGFTLDQTPPAAPTSAPDLLVASDSGSSNSDNITNNTQPRLVVGALPQGVAGAQLLVNGTVVAATYDANDGTLRPVQALGEGENSLSFRWVDTAGNTGAAGPALTVQISTAAPSFRMTNIDISADTGNSNSDFVTSTAAQTITGQLNNPLTAGELVFGSFNGGSSWTDITSLINADGQLTWAGVTLPAGSSSLQFKLVGVAGNDSAISRQDYSLDQTAPATVLQSIAISGDTGVSASDFITKETTQTVTGRLMVGNQPQALQSGDRLWASSNGGTSWQDITASVSGDAFTWANVSLTNGASSLQFKVIDAAGNEGGVSRQDYTLDTVAPAAPQTQNSAPFDLLSSAQDTGSLNTDDITNVSRPAFMVENRPVDAVGAELLINGRVVDATFSAQDNTLTPNEALTDGVYQVSYRYIDAAGNVSAAGAATQVTIDTRAPANTSLTTFTPTSIGGTYEPGSTLSLKVNGVDIAANRIVLNAANRTWSLEPTTAELTTAGTGLLNKATSTFELTASDTAGNVTVASQTVSKDVFNAPFVKEFIPGDGGILANDTSGNATLNLIFSKTVRAGTGTIKLWNVAGDTLVSSINVSDSAVRVDGSDVYVTLPGLTTGTRYYVTLDAGTFVDSAGQNYAGKSEIGTSGWDFTGAVASIAPDFVAQDDIINIAESAAEVRITGKVVSSAAVLEDIVSANLSVSVAVPQGAAAVNATLQSYNNRTGEFVFTVPASAWANGSYGYTVSLTGNAGDANGVTANYNFANLAVDLVAPTGIASSISNINDNVGQPQGDLFATSWMLNPNFATTAGITKVTDINVTDLDLSKLSALMTGSGPYFYGPANYNTASTIYNSDRTSVTFWFQVFNFGSSKAVQLELADTVDGIRFKALQAKHVLNTNVGASFDWNTGGIVQSISTSFGAAGYGLVSAGFMGDNMSSTMLGIGNTDDNTPTLTGRLTRALAQDERVSIDRTDGQGNTVSITGTAGLVMPGTSWLFTESTLADGQYTYRVFVEDAAGNRTSASTPRTIIVDTQAPVAVVSTANLSQDTGRSSTDGLTNVAAQTITGTLSAALGSGEKLMASLNGGTTFVDITNMVSGNSFNWTGVTLREGDNAIRLQVVDAAGNRGTAWDQTFTLDTASPTAPTAAPDLLAADDAGSSNSDNVTTVTRPRIAIDPLPAGAVSAELLIGGVVASSQFDPATNTLTVNQALANGRYAVSYRYVDAAGNSSGTAPLLSLTIGPDSSARPVAPVVIAQPLAITTEPKTSPRFLTANYVRPVGDVNNDGYDDFAVSGVPGAGALLETVQSVFYGSASYTTPVMNLTQISASARTVLTPTNIQSPDRFGAIAGAGDFNGDGKADVLGASQGSGSGVITPPSVNIYFNNRPGIRSVEGQQILGGEYVVNDWRGRVSYYDGLGGGVNGMSSAGDLNADGRDDLVIAADMSDLLNRPSAIRPGQIYAVYGTASAADIDVSSGRIAAGAGFKVSTSTHGQLGYNLRGVGDLNGDGYADFAARNLPGESFFVYGSATGIDFNLAAMTSAQGFKLSGLAALQMNLVVNGVTQWLWQQTIAYAGDFNGDGFADTAISDPANGKLYIVTGTPTSSNLTATGFNSSNGYVIVGLTSERFAHEVSYAGDLNADGFGDLIVSAEAADGGKGNVYVIFGRGGPEEIQLSDIRAGRGGFVMTNSATSASALGFNVSNAGDVNGDGLEDLIVGTAASNYDPYLILNHQAFSGSRVTQMGTAFADRLSDNSVSGSLIGGLGNDELTANAVSVLYGGAGNDTFVIGDAMATALESSYGNGGNYDRLARIDGGSGRDTIRLAAGVDLDLTSVANQSAGLLEGGSRIDDVEVIDLGAQGANTLKLNLFDVIDMSSSNVFQATGRKQLLVNGTAADTLDFADGAGTSGWTQAGSATIDTVAYQVWNHDTAFATVYVQNGMLVV